MRISVILLLVIMLCFSRPFSVAADIGKTSAFRLEASQTVNGQFVVTLKVLAIHNLYGFEARLSFDPDRLEFLGYESNRDGFSVSPIVKKDGIIIAHTQIGDVSGESGDITIGALTFKLKKHGEARVKWDSMKVVTDKLQSMTTTVGESISAGKTFVDLIEHWARDDIEKLAFEKVIEGMDDDHFLPDATVTRAQFTAMVARALKLHEAAAPIPFADVTPDSWYRGIVSSAYAAGLIKGMTESSFAPEKEITREQAATMIIRAGKYASEGALKEADSAYSLPFADAGSISEWAVKDIATAVRVGIINGRTADTFAPHDPATRAEAAVMVKRLFFQ
ncbi:S-layer homology domain-containing protein [Paenibacillus sp. MBLB4367]|uniref:S-layer homology domain-containing protein n=1 Tax=Paenibacillus sp. MBLB4367 TaxID=3384767 RepID=UPI0039080C36